MIFVFNESIIEVLEQRTVVSKERQEKLIDAIENIAKARKTGEHLVYASLKTLKALKNSDLIGINHRRIFSYLYNHFTDMKIVYKTFKTHVELYADEAVMQIYNDGEYKKIKVSLEFFQKQLLVTRTRLLCENLHDVKFYEKLANIYLYTKNMRNVRIHFKGQGGGGHTTSKEYENICKIGEELCICIADSDEKYRGSDYGDTLKELLEIEEKKNCCFTELYPLKFREVENMIPTAILAKVCAGNIDWEKGLRFLEQIEKKGMLDVRKHFDMKYGVQWKKIKNNNTAYEKYWMDVVSQLGMLTEGHKEDNEVIVNGVGKSVLERVINYLDSVDIMEILNDIPDYLKEEWTNLGEFISTWCCSQSSVHSV